MQVTDFDCFVIQLAGIVEEAERVKEAQIEQFSMKASILREQELLRKEFEISRRQREINYQLGCCHEIAIDEEIRVANLDVAILEIDIESIWVDAGLRFLAMEIARLCCKLYQLLFDFGCTRAIRQIREAEDPILAAKEYFCR